MQTQHMDDSIPHFDCCLEPGSLPHQQQQQQEASNAEVEAAADQPVRADVLTRRREGSPASSPYSMLHRNLAGDVGQEGDGGRESLTPVRDAVERAELAEQACLPMQRATESSAGAMPFIPDDGEDPTWQLPNPTSLIAKQGIADFWL